LTIQEKREDLFCYSSKSSIAKRLVGMNMKKQYSRYDVMYRYNIGCIRYIYKTEWALHCLYPPTFEIGDFDFRIKQKTLSISLTISPVSFCKYTYFCSM